MNKQIIEHTRLLELLAYDEDTGMFSWKVRRGCVSAGTQCTNIGSEGYYRIRVDKVLYSAHRLAWYYWYGEYPEGQMERLYE